MPPIPGGSPAGGGGGGTNQGGTYRIYSVNYLNFLQINPPTTSTRASIMQGAATGLLGSLNGVNIGLMSYDTSGTISDGNGGMVTNAIDDIEDNRQPMINEIKAWHFAGNTPLSETLAKPIAISPAARSSPAMHRMCAQWTTRTSAVA